MKCNGTFLLERLKVVMTRLNANLLMALGSCVCCSVNARENARTQHAFDTCCVLGRFLCVFLLAINLKAISV